MPSITQAAKFHPLWKYRSRNNGGINTTKINWTHLKSWQAWLILSLRIICSSAQDYFVMTSIMNVFYKEDDSALSIALRCHNKRCICFCSCFMLRCMSAQFQWQLLFIYVLFTSPFSSFLLLRKKIFSCELLILMYLKFQKKFILKGINNFKWSIHAHERKFFFLFTTRFTQMYITLVFEVTKVLEVSSANLYRNNASQSHTRNSTAPCDSEH
jgi:hypothetical protein